MPVRVLVPVDDSVATHRTLQYIIKMQAQIPMTVTLLMVVPSSQLEYHGFQKAQIEAIMAKSIDHCEKLIERYRLELDKAGVLADTRVERGNPAEVICHMAANEGVDFVFISANSSGKISNLVFGSVTNRVIHECHQPVLLIR